MKKKLSPVFYQNLNSRFSSGLIRNMSDFAMIDIEDRFKDIVFDLLRLSKEYEGTLKRENKIISKKCRFADEREWRFVPEMNMNKKFPDFLLESDYNTADKKRIANTKLSGE